MYTPTENDAHVFAGAVVRPNALQSTATETRLAVAVRALLATPAYNEKGITLSKVVSAKSGSTNVFLAIEGAVDNLTDAERGSLGMAIQGAIQNVTGRKVTSLSISQYKPPVTVSDEAVTAGVSHSATRLNLNFGLAKATDKSDTGSLAPAR